MKLQPPATSTAPLATTDEEIELPHRMRLLRQHGSFVLTRRWLRIPLVLFLGVWCAVWDTGVFGAIFAGELPLLFWFTHGTAGVLVTYYWLALLFNTTTLSVENRWLSVRHGPLWWPRPRDTRVEDVQQLFVRERRSNKGQTSYEVHARLAGDRKLLLVRGLAKREQAALIERLVEEHLAIEDEPGA